MIVAVPLLSLIDTLPHDSPMGLVNSREKSSTHSFTPSPVAATGTVSNVTPGLNVSVPLALV